MKKDRPETQSELGEYDAAYWLREIEARQAALEGWYEKAEEAEERYRDDCKRGFGRLNVLWANVETQKAAIGEDFGKPEVRRINTPENDGGLARHVSLVWERTIAAAVREDDDNHDIKLAVADVFLPGRGVVWQEVEAENANWIKAPLVRVSYRDYLEGTATRWGGVPWVSRCHLWTRDDIKQHCPELTDAQLAKIPLKYNPLDRRQRRKYDSKQQDQFKRAIVHEIWSKYPKKCRIFVAEGFTDRVISYKADPFKLKGFFPTPRPMLASGDEGWQEPITDFSRYEDQSRELDQVCQRIYVLTALLRWRGCFDSAFPELKDLLAQADTVFIGVKDYTELLAKGGLVAAFQAVDISPIMVILEGLHEQRRTLIELIYELSGISDLARGSTDPTETLGAQQLKKTYGSNRFRMREDDSRRFAAEAYSIKGEIIAEMFTREQMEAMSGIHLPKREEIDKAKGKLQQIMAVQQAAQQAGKQVPPPDENEMRELQRTANCKWSWEDVSGVLESDYRRCYVCDVQTDQSEFMDDNAEQTNRSNFFNMVMMTFEKAAPMIAGNPKAGEVYKQLIMFVIASFKAGRSQEEGLEQAIDGAIATAVQQSQQQQQDPKVAAEQATAEARVKAAELGLQTQQVRLQIEETKGQQIGMKAQEEAQRSQIKAAEGAQKVQQQAEANEAKRVGDAQKVQAQHETNQAKRAGHAIALNAQAQKAAFEASHQATMQEVRTAGPTITKPKARKAAA
jgi:hypothetical protein